MIDKERPFSPEAKKIPLFPSSRDLVIIDGQFMQCISADSEGASFVLLEDKSKGIHISPEEWTQYKYTAPPKNVISARGLVEKGLMTNEQLDQVYWGPEENKHPHLKKTVTFFGTYTKKK